jgi:hypothetical protein
VFITATSEVKGCAPLTGQNLFMSSPLNIFVSEKDGLTVYDKTLL